MESLKLDDPDYWLQWKYPSQPPTGVASPAEFELHRTNSAKSVGERTSSKLSPTRESPAMSPSRQSPTRRRVRMPWKSTQSTPAYQVLQAQRSNRNIENYW